MRRENWAPGLTRRSWMQRAALISAGMVLPRIAWAATQDASSGISPVMERLSAYMAEARNRALPDNVVQETTHHILDTIAAMVSGSELAPGRMAIQFAQDYGGEKIATVVASRVVCGPIEAAFANGMLAHSDETDDDFTTGGAHPGCAVVPAALASAEKFGISGTHFLRAVALGYDIGMRAMKTVGAGMKETHNLVGTMGATAAAGCAAGLSAQQMRWLLDYAAQQAGAGIGAWRRDTEHIEKAFVFGAMGARNGVNAALLIHSGWTGVNDILSGPNNFVESYNSKADPAGMIEQLGERYGVVQTTIKKWTTGGPIQAPLDALESLRKRQPFAADQVKQVVVRAASSAAYTVNNRDMPDICLQHLVAVMLVDKTVSFRAAHDGTPENPMTRDEVVAKARELMAPVLGAATCSSLIERVLALDTVKDVRELRPLLQGDSKLEHRKQ